MNRSAQLKHGFAFVCGHFILIAYLSTIIKELGRATTSAVAKMCKMQKVFNFAHFNLKNTHINVCKYV